MSEWNVVIDEILKHADAGIQLTRKDYFASVISELQQKTQPQPKVVVGFLGAIGDIGACVNDVLGVRKDKAPIKVLVSEAAEKFFGPLTDKVSQIVPFNPDVYYKDEAKKYDKKSERKTCANDAGKTKMDPRAGVMSVGKDADTKLGIKPDLALPSIGWPWQTVPKKLVDYCPDEPWAGHYSGSLPELFLMLDIFNRKDVKAEAAASPELKKVYAGIASAFLIATGMHSAVELNYVVKNYLGTPVAKEEILNQQKNCQGATNDAVNLISGVTQ